MNFIYRWLYDKRLEIESTRRSQVASKGSGSSDARSKKTDGRMDASGIKVEIPDPWD